MPKRRSAQGGRSKKGGASGANRGGRGGSSGRGSGRGRGRGGNARRGRGAPELYDLERAGPDVGAPSMKSLSRRGRPSLMEEVGYTSRHAEGTLRQPLRNKPIEFVKAGVYRPAAIEPEVPETAAEAPMPCEHQELMACFENASLDERPTRPRVEMSDGWASLEDEHEVEGPALPPGRKRAASSEAPKAEAEAEGSEGSEGTEGADGTEGTDGANGTEGFVAEAEGSEGSGDSPESQLPAPPSPGFVIDTAGDESLAAGSNGARRRKARRARASAASASASAVSYDPTLTIGKTTLHTEITAGGTHALLRAARGASGFDGSEWPDESTDEDDRAAYKDYISQIMQGMEEDSDSEGESEAGADDGDADPAFLEHGSADAAGAAGAFPGCDSGDVADDADDTGSGSGSGAGAASPEYGFLPEDFEFDVSQLSVSNLRFGVENQYYTLCAELTGSDEPLWVDEADLADFAVQKGVRPHRLASFLRYVAGGLGADEAPADYSDVYISESDDGLDDLVAFEAARATTPPPTRRRGPDDLADLSLTAEMHAAMQDRFQTHREAKRARKQARGAARHAAAVAQNDLAAMYPLALHVEEMRAEFERFLHDALRDTMSFPPLDAHGNATVKKIATFYNMRTLKNRGGLKTYVLVTKSRKTFHRLPDYALIMHVLRQRPVFHRSDRPRDDATRDAHDAKAPKKAPLGAHVREGDVVGSAAPAIGPANIGRQLLERLGWTAGEGLGAQGRGISEPVVAVVKNSKLGLRTAPT